MRQTVDCDYCEKSKSGKNSDLAVLTQAIDDESQNRRCDEPKDRQELERFRPFPEKIFRPDQGLFQHPRDGAGRVFDREQTKRRLLVEPAEKAGNPCLDRHNKL